MCWPLFPRCHELRPFLTAGLVTAFAVGVIAVALLSAFLFHRRRATPALLAFIAAGAGGAVLYALDYRMRVNQVYMLSWVSIAFLLAPKKLETLQALVVLFYVWAGTLKLDAEWLTGAALYKKPFFVPESLVPAACVYVVVLELVLVWGLFARSAQVRWAVLAQLAVFHVVSWGVVGYYYPLLMFALLSVFPLVWKLEPERALSVARLREPDVRKPVAVTACAFSAFQLPPLFARGDSALSGEGRLFALHMFDARSQCEGTATIIQGTKRTEVTVINPGLDTRTRCDPIVLYETTKRLCRELRARAIDRALPRVDLAIDAKRTSAAAMAPLVRVTNFCENTPRYSVLGSNDWIVVARP